MSTKNTVFISHIHEDAALGTVVKRWIVDVFGGHGIAVFLSSDPLDIPAGRKWLEEVALQLDDTGVMISLISPTSLARPWVNIELGAAWIKGASIIPVCYAGQTIAELPRPFGDFNGVDLSDDEAAKQLISGVANAVKVTHPQGLHWAEILRQMRDAAPTGGKGPVSNSALVGEGLARLTNIPKQQIEILQLLAQSKDSGRAELSMTEATVGSGLRPSAFSFHAGQLCSAGLIDVAFWDDEEHYRILTKGIEYLITNSLL